MHWNFEIFVSFVSVHAWEQAKLTFITKCMTTINKIYLFYFIHYIYLQKVKCENKKM